MRLNKINKISRIQEKSLNSSINIIAVITIIPVLLVILRAGFDNLHVYEYIQVICLLTLLFIALFKNKISYSLKTILFVGSLLISGLSVFTEHGLYGIGIVMILAGCLFASFYFGRRATIIIAFISFLYISIVGILYHNSIIEVDTNFEQIINSPFSWIISIIMVSLIAGLYIYNYDLLINVLAESLFEINKRTEELVKSNDKLSNEIFNRKKTEIALRINEEKYKALFDDANDTIIIVENNKIVNCNKRAEELFNTTKENIINKAVADLSPEFQPDGSLSKDKSLSILTRSGKIESQRFEWQHSTLDGKIIDTEVSLRQVVVGNKTFVQAMIRDISVRKAYERELILHRANLEKLVLERTQELEHVNSELNDTNKSLNELNNLLEKENKIRELAEEELLKYQQELREANATKDKFFSIIAHDLKNPFHLIINFSELLSGKMGDYEDEKRKMFIEHISNTAKYGYELLKNLLSWARSQTNTISFDRTYLHLEKITSETLHLLVASAAEKDILINVNIPNKSIAFADVEMIKTVIRNLLTNAIKFTNKGGVINISTKYHNGFYIYSISDNGVGMTQEQIDGIFKIGRGGRSTNGTMGEDGTGLGLLLCKEFVEKNNGKIWVESIVGNGTTFYFTLPVKE